MAADRTYSTRELAQMWNVSESTVKRWADSFGLRCHRTPGGHRRFKLADVCEFQQERSFEATGLLTTEKWEDPNLEIWLNSRRFDKVSELLLYLATQNQQPRLSALLERLHLRGMRLEEIYDEVLVPVNKLVEKSLAAKSVLPSQALLVTSNLEEALLNLVPKLVRRRKNGKTALCAAPTHSSRITVLAMSKILEIEGWDSLTLGENVEFSLMSEMVELEPVNLVCLFVASNRIEKAGDCSGLNQTTKSYRIPVVVVGKENHTQKLPKLRFHESFSSLCDLRRYVARLNG